MIEATLPQVPESEPVFIPLTAGDLLDIKHITLKGMGNDNHSGNSDPNWTSIAEIRYSDSSTAPAGVTSVEPTAHAAVGNSFCEARHGSIDGDWSDYIDYRNNVYTGNPLPASVDTTIDGNIAASNYWASDGPVSLGLELCGTRKVTAINLWMHKSNLRTSDIKVSAMSAYAEGSTQVIMENVHIPMTPANTPTRIEFDTPILAREIMLEFTANSISRYNSIGEVSWE